MKFQPTERACDILKPSSHQMHGWSLERGEVEGLFCLKEGFPELELIESGLGSASYHYVRDRGPNLMPNADRDADCWLSLHVQAGRTDGQFNGTRVSVRLAALFTGFATPAPHRKVMQFAEINK